MKCIICKNGETQPGKGTVTLQRDGTIVIVKEVPAEVCDNCAEYYFSEEITEKLLAKAGQAAASGVEVEIIKFAA